MKLSKRLYSCVTYTKGFHNLADIGTDHAYLPIYAIENGFVFKAQAIDNKEGPFVIAYSNIKKAGLQERIEVKKADGISKIDDDTDVVVISGMGGILITKILSNHEIKNIKRLILQPNSDSYDVRKKIMELGFYISDELIFVDSNKYYEVIVADKGDMSYNELELLFGPINVKHKPYYFVQKYQKEKENLEKILTNDLDKTSKIKILARIKLIEEALSWMESK